MSWFFRSFGIALMLAGVLIVAFGVAAIWFLFFFAMGSSAAVAAVPFSFAVLRNSAEDLSPWVLAVILLGIPLTGLALGGLGKLVIRLSRTEDEKRRAVRAPQDSWPD